MNCGVGPVRNCVDITDFFNLEVLRADTQRVYRVTAPYPGGRVQQAIWDGISRTMLGDMTARYRWVPWRGGRPFPDDRLLPGDLAVSAYYSHRQSKIEQFTK